MLGGRLYVKAGLGKGRERRCERHNHAGMASVTRQMAVSRVSLAVQAFFFSLARLRQVLLLEKGQTGDGPIREGRRRGGQFRDIRKLTAEQK